MRKSESPKFPSFLKYIHSLYSNKCVDGGLFNSKKKELTTKKALLIKFEISTTINIVTQIKLIL